MRTAQSTIKQNLCNYIWSLCEKNTTGFLHKHGFTPLGDEIELSDNVYGLIMAKKL